MDGFLFALLLVLALAMGGRDQWMVARWSDALGRSHALLAVAVLASVLAAGLMAWVGAQFAAMLPSRAGQMLVAFALAAAAFELAVPVTFKTPEEPTRSLGAIMLVLLARQIGDGARFAVFALAAWTQWPLTAGLGGALGGAAAGMLGWSIGGEQLARWPLKLLRWVLAAGLAVAALFIGLDARFGA